MPERTCPGTCCTVFPLSSGATLDEFRARAAGVLDGAAIAEMLVPLTREQAEQRGRRFGAAVPDDPALPLFTCRHLDEKTRLCRIYTDRPQMCRDYPYDRECEHGCGLRSPAEIVEKWREIRRKKRASGSVQAG